MSTQPTIQSQAKPQYAVIHRNWRDYKEVDNTYTQFNLNERNSAQLEAYHALAERLLATGDWITHENQLVPELLLNQNPSLDNKNTVIQLERLDANSTFTAADYIYNLILIRYYFKDGELNEMSINLPIGKHDDGLTLMAYTAIETRACKIPLEEAVEDLDAVVAKIEALYRKEAASADGMAYRANIKHMPIDWDLLKERFLLQRVNDKHVSYPNYSELQVKSFSQALFMNVSFVSDKVQYDYRVDITYYRKLLKERQAMVVNT